MSNPSTPSRFEEIYNSTSKKVLAFIISKCGRTADIDDIFQDTYLELHQVLCKRGAEYIQDETAFMLQIARRKVSKYYSLYQRLRMFVSAISTNEDGEEVDLTELEADSFLTEDFAVNQIMAEVVQQFLQQKPEEVKKIFYLFYDIGLTIPEIANELSIKESGVKNKLYRTIKELRKLLNKGEQTI